MPPLANAGHADELKSNRIQGLDSIRFVCALIVMLGHIPFPLPSFLDSDAQGAFKILRGVIRCAFNGPAAVIIFFIISGFCIHYPFRASLSIPLGSYLVRRLTRICIPAIIAVAIWIVAGIEMDPPSYVVFWSIVCEIVYYVIYPILFQIQRRVGWLPLIITAYVVAYASLILNQELLVASTGAYTALGWWTWAVGLPCWLLGCWLADNYKRFPELSGWQMWFVRVIIFGMTIGLRAMKFHVHSVWANNALTLNAFSFVACLWIGLEIIYYQRRSPWRILEWGGKWSYSLYLMHYVAPTLVEKCITLSPLPSTLVNFSTAILISYLFFLVVEYPSHKVSRRLGQLMGGSKGES